MRGRGLNAFALVLVVVAGGLLAFKNSDRGGFRPILNVSYDPTRELYGEITPLFVARYEEEAGNWAGVAQSHGASTSQARAVADGLAADVVTLALPSDIDILVKHGLISRGWRERLPHNAQPYFSTIVFVVRKSNPRQIRDWPDLIRPDVTVVTPDPATSGNGKLSLLAAWGSVLYRGGTEEQAREFLTQLHRRVPILGQAARNSSTTFAMEGVGDVHLAWESEAIREVAQSKGDLELVYPSVSIRAEPSVAWVDANVAKHGSETTAQAFLKFLFTDPAQEILAGQGFRPINGEILKKHANRLPGISLFPVTLIARDWNDADAKFFGKDGILGFFQPTKIR